MHSARSLWGSTRNAKLLVALTSLALSFVGSVASSARAQSSAGVGVSAGTGADVSGSGSAPAPGAGAAVESAEVPPPVDLSTPGAGAAGQGAQPVAPAEAAAPAAPPPPSQQAWELRHRAFNTWEGSTGSMFIVDPGVGEPGAVRMQLALDTFSGSNFLYEGDNVEQDRQFLSVSWTALRVLEITGAIENQATVADLPRQNSLHALGDAQLGVKVGGAIGPIFRVGGLARLLIANDVGEQSSLLEATSIGLGVNAALDLQGLPKPLPLIARLNFEYLFDNSGKVLDDTETTRYNALEDALPRVDETRHLVTRVERFGLGMNRVDMMTLGLGVEAPFALGEHFFLHPMVDFRVGIPLNRQGYDCAFHSNNEERGTNAEGADDTCLDDAGFATWPMLLAVGVRVVPPIRGVSVLIGADFGLHGTDTFVRELAPTPPYRLLLAVSYDYDARPAAPGPATVATVAEAPAAPARVLRGHVTDQTSGQPIAGAVVRFVSNSGTAPALRGGASFDRPPVATDATGTFIGRDLVPGDIEVEVTHADYKTRRCATSVPVADAESAAAADAELTCALVPVPSEGSLRLSLHDQFGAAVPSARVSVAGPSMLTAVSDTAGEVVATGFLAGEYTARIESDAHFVRVLRFSVTPRQQARLEAALLRRPAVPDVQLQGTEILAPKLHFEGQTTDLGPEAAESVAELADLMLRDASMRRVRIQGDGGEQLALVRALMIKQRLVDAGVPDARLEAVADPGKKVTLTLVQ